MNQQNNLDGTEVLISSDYDHIQKKRKKVFNKIKSGLFAPQPRYFTPKMDSHTQTSWVEFTIIHMYLKL